MNRTLSADQLSRYVGMRIRNPAAADRYWATCVGRNIAVDAAMDDETAAQIKEFLKTKLSPGDHAQVCDMLEAAAGDPEAEDDDLPKNAVERPPQSKKGSAGINTDAKIGFDQRYPGLAHVKIDNSGIQPERAARYSNAAAASFAARFPGLARIKLA